MDYGKETEIARTYGAEMLNVTPKDLQAFFKRGGKLLLSHGWTDGLIPANNTVKFYGELIKVAPRSAVDKQLRLFMVPGMDHCGGGEGASNYDTLGTIDAWATSGVAPERIVRAVAAAARPAVRSCHPSRARSARSRRSPAMTARATRHPKRASAAPRPGDGPSDDAVTAPPKSARVRISAHDRRWDSQ